MRRVIPPFLVVLALCSSSPLAFAGPPEVATAEPTPAIQGGTTAASCQWPTSVALFNGSGMCTGTLVHPRVVMTAAHCMDQAVGGEPDEIRFGEQTFEPVFEVPVSDCQQNPGWSGNVGPTDFAYCVLAQPVDLPLTPPLMGCELEQLIAGTPVYIVGFGNTSEDGGAGTKRFGLTEIVSDGVGETVSAGTAEISTCSGDSGGTGYVQLADGGWRSWGILSGGPGGCGNYGIYVSMHHAVPWIEEQTGFDITPCHDADGTWNPGPECSGFATTPMAGGSWAQGCPSPLGDEPATCGPGYGAPPDVDAPAVAIVDPVDQAVYPEIPTALDVTIETDDGEGFAVLKVELYIDGELVSDRERLAWDPPGPWVFGNAEFPAGTFTLSARAFDYVGNVGESDPVVFTVGEAPGDGDGDGDGDAEDTGTEDDGGTETGAPIGDDGGCNCAASGSAGKTTTVTFAAIVLLLGRRRRKRRRS